MSVEYAVLLAVPAVAAVGVWTTLGAPIRTKVASAGNQVTAIR